MFSLVPSVVADEVAPLLRLTDDFARWPALISRCVPQPLCHLGESEVHNTDNQFRIRMDLQHFNPEDIKVTSDNNCITVHAKHEEKQDNHGFVSREVTRIYKLPENCDPRSVTSTMNDQGILNIKVDKKALEAPKETSIPVQYK